MQLLLQRCYCCHNANHSQLFAGLALAARLNRFPVDVSRLNLLDSKLLLLVFIREKTNTAVEKKKKAFLAVSVSSASKSPTPGEM